MTGTRFLSPSPFGKFVLPGALPCPSAQPGQRLCFSVTRVNAGGGAGIPGGAGLSIQNLVTTCYKTVRTQVAVRLTGRQGATRPFATNAAWVTGISRSRNDSAACATFRISCSADSWFRSEEKCISERGLQLQ